MSEEQNLLIDQQAAELNAQIDEVWRQTNTHQEQEQ